MVKKSRRNGEGILTHTFHCYHSERPVQVPRCFRIRQPIRFIPIKNPERPVAMYMPQVQLVHTFEYDPGEVVARKQLLVRSSQQNAHFVNLSAV